MEEKVSRNKTRKSFLNESLDMLETRLKSTAAEVLLLFFCLLTVNTLGQTNGPGVVRVVVKEGSDVVLPCSLRTKENIALGLFDWKKDDQKEVFLYQAGLEGQDEQFKGRVSPFPEELKNGNASIMIRNTKTFDSGNYTCYFPHLQPSRRKFRIELVVEPVLKDRSGETGTTPKPYIRIVDATKDWALLQCEVHGAFPKPEVEWQDSAGNILPAKKPQVAERGHYDVILLTTVTKTDRFRCVVKQEEIHHMIDAQTFVYIDEKRCEDWAAWFFGGLFLGVAAVTAFLVATKCILISHNKGSPQQRNSSYL